MKTVDTVIFESMVDIMSRQDIFKEYRKLAKRANQRIVELGHHGIVTNSKDIAKFGLNPKEVTWLKGEAITALSMQGRTRFREFIPKSWNTENLNTLRAELKRLNRFLESKQTTITGRKSLTEAVHEQFQNYGVMLSDEDMNTFLKSFSTLKDKIKYSYREALEIFSAYTIERPNLTSSQIKHAMNMLTYSPNADIARQRLIKASHATKSEFIAQMNATRKEIQSGFESTQKKRAERAKALRKAKREKRKIK